MNHNISTDRIAELITLHPESRKYLYILFPEAKEALENSTFCRPGDLILRKGNTNTILTVVRINHNEFVIANLSSTGGNSWNNPVRLKDSYYVTIREFTKLAGNRNINNFSVIGKLRAVENTNVIEIEKI